MPSNHAYDSQEFKQLFLPYAPNLSKLATQPVLVDGNNLMATWGGTLKKRPPMQSIGPTLAVTQRCDRLWVYETLEPNPSVYMVGSWHNAATNTWNLRWFNLNGPGTPNWITATERRACNHSTLAHEGIVRRGKLYIKSFPLNAGPVNEEGSTWDVLGSVFLDGTGGNGCLTHDWGMLGPTSPAALTDPAGWNSSANPVTVLNSWLYTYTWVSQSGNESNRAPLQTNPSLSPSGTGPFTNKTPTMTVTGLTDTSEYPYINIYRTTDGGGTFFFLYQLVNDGSGSMTFTDQWTASGSGGNVFNDPTPDTDLDTTHVAPTTTSNGPPPTVAPPAVTGSDAIQPCSRIVEYAGRIWFGIDEYLFYSALEELNEGVPEECFPAGIDLPNFFRMPKGIAQLEVTPSGLLVTTRTETIRVEGTNRASFNPRPFLGGIGGAAQQNRASTEAGDYAAWLSQDFRVVVVHGDSYAVLSNPIGKVIENYADAGALIDIKFWAHGDKQWLIVAAHDPVTPANTRWVIYEMNLSLLKSDDFWFVPWTVASTSLAVGQKNITDSENKLWVTLWDGTNTLLSRMNIDATDYEDLNPATGTNSPYNWTLTTSLLEAPAGDHLNKLEIPSSTPALASISINRIAIPGDTDPTLSVYYDDFFTSPIDLTPGDIPPRRPQSIGYTSLIYDRALKVCQHVSTIITGNTDAYGAELYQMSFNWLPGSGD